MKHVTYSDKALLMDDEAADLLLEYAVELAKRGDADLVTVHALSGDGNEVAASFVLDSGTVLMAESAHTHVQPPKDEEAIAYLRSQLEQLRAVPAAGPISHEEAQALRSHPTWDEG
jgi:nucleotide-binding universal stress UspA family protein